MEYYVYILTNKINSVLYVGVTNNLLRRIEEHKNEIVEGFSKKYKTKKLVYYEKTNDIYEAINREKQLKGWKRDKKNNLINSQNPQWNDLWEEIIQ